jgi:threonylcarbamoyladenosine tRNA methylthiotransferase MtaB
MPLSSQNSSPRTVSISTLGCKLNQYESESILTQFRSAGYAVSDDGAPADICVVNTCSVTLAAERKARNMLRGVQRRNPQAKILAVGCMAERTPESLAGIPGVSAVSGNREKEHILDFLPGSTGGSPSIRVGGINTAEGFPDSTPVTGLLGRTRSFIKVQDGCSQHCTYCIIPSLRGRCRSLNVSGAVEQARRLTDAGFLEVVITGVALGTYGTDLTSGDDLPKLLSELERVPGLRRIRLGSVEPWAVDERLLRTIAESEVICPHIHLPLQSADDTVLKLMNRRYTAARISSIFETAYSLREDWGFGSDLIVGFPGEGPDEFEATRKFIAESPLAYLHVFPFSSRPGTPATRLPNHVTEPEKKQRVAAMKSIDSSLRQTFRGKHVNTRSSVLFEDRHVGEYLAGHTANYLDVYVKAPESLAGTLSEVTIAGIHPNGVVGVLAEPE